MVFLVLINRIICSTYLLLMFFEMVFGICIGCRIYNLFSRKQAQLLRCQTLKGQPRGF